MATKRTVVSGQHRSMTLAVARLEQLQRENPFATVRIIARRNDKGHFSERGRHFQFEIVTAPPLEDLDNYFDAYDEANDYDEQEWESAADYHTE